MSDDAQLNLLRELDNDDRVMTGAVMTTFSFAPQFFERAVLPALRDKSIGDTVAVLADTAAYDSTMTEPDAANNGATQLNSNKPNYAGQRYHLAPVSAGLNRAFHPKVHFVAGKRRVHATVASANLTHPGLMNNQEIATRFTVDAPPNNTAEDNEQEQDTSHDPDLTQREQAAICIEIADFIRSLTSSQFGQSIDAVTTNTIEQTLSAADWLQEIDLPDSTARSTQFIHTLDDSLITQIQEHINRHDEEIQAVDIAAPFYGTSMQLPRTFTDDGIDTTIWLQHERAQILPEKLRDWLTATSATAMSYEANRYVHGKTIALKTNDAAYCVSGSPNASHAAFLSPASADGNIEAALLRRVPDPNYFDYLFEQPPFATADTLDTETFEANTDLGNFGNQETATTDDDDAETPVELYGVSYQRRESYDGGTVIVTGTMSTAIRDQLDADTIDAELLVATPESEPGPATISFDAHQFDWDETNTTTNSIPFRASRDLYGTAAEKPLTRTTQAHFQCGGHTSRSRWIQTHTPTTGEPTTTDVENAGATTVPQALTELYVGDPDRQTEIMDSLNGLLTALRDIDAEAPTEQPTPTESQDPQQPSGGLSVRPWNQSSAKDPQDIIDRYFSGWQSDLDDFINNASPDNYYFDEIETRLTAINTTTLQLLLLNDAHSNIDIPRQTLLNTIKDVYTQQDLRGEHGESLIANYCRYLQNKAEHSEDDAHEVYEGLQTHILPQILLATLITESHVAADRETYFNQQDWAFEALVCDCFQDQYPHPELLDSDWVTNVTTQILESTESIRARIEESHQLSRYADTRYLEENPLKEAVVEILLRSCLLHGKDAIQAHQQQPHQLDHVDWVFEEYTSYLPATQQRQTERWL